MTHLLKAILLGCSVLFFQSFSAPMEEIKPMNSSEITGGWRLLGSKTVKAGLDRDVIKVTASRGVFKKLKIRVKGAPIYMQKMVVHYGNGTTQSLAIRKNIAQGSESRVMDLPGKNRAIKKIVFWYEKGNWTTKKPVVTLWGRA